MSDDDDPEPIRANRDFDAGLRLGIAAQLGQFNSFDDGTDGLRDTWETFGWPKDPGPVHYLGLYLRNAFCRVVVDKPAFTTWRVTPDVVDGEDTERESRTDFEADVAKLYQNHDLRSYFERVDRVAGVGEHGLLAISFSDVTEGDDADTKAWATDARDAGLSGLDDVNTFKPLLQTQIDDIDWGGPDSERWGQPEFYHIDWSDDIDDESEGEQGPFTVHWTRVIDVPATRLLDDETLARPRAEPVVNNLLDIEKALGSSAELSYRGADYGLHLNWDPAEVDVSQLDSGEVEEDLQRWYHNLDPAFKTFGAELKTLGGDTIDPSPIVDNNLKAIYAQTGIPKREFIGNQQGEQSGAEQDTKSYLGTITERAEHYATPFIVRRTFDQLREVGVLSDPSGGTYEVEWPDRHELSELEQSQVEANRASVITTAGQFIAGLTGDNGLEYMESGAFPDLEQAANVADAELDERSDAVWGQFEQIGGVEGPADD